MIFSIVTPSYNQGKFIEQCINSVITQEGEFYIDYIIMDGGSRDSTLEIIRRIEREFCRNAQVERIRGLSFFSPKHGHGNSALCRCKGVSFRWTSGADNGQVDALNKGFTRAVGDIYAFLNSDDTYYPGVLQKIREADWERTDIIYGEAVWVDEFGQEICPYPTIKPSIRTMRWRCTLCQPAVFWKRDTHRCLRGFNDIFSSAFDYEYWIRALFAGMRFTYVPVRIARSRMYPSNKTLGSQDVNSWEVSQIHLMWYPPFTEKHKILTLPLDFLFWFYVSKKTSLREKKLFKVLLGRHRSESSL